jgi:hypothetical protein
MLSFESLALRGEEAEAESLWELLSATSGSWSRNRYRAGDLEAVRAEYLFDRSKLSDSFLSSAEELALAGQNRRVVRLLYMIHGKWCLQVGDTEGAIENLTEAVRVAREVGLKDSESESWLALARLPVDDHATTELEAERLSSSAGPANLALAQLWIAIGNTKRAEEYALAAYRDAWADGAPYSKCFQLRRAREILESLDVEIPRMADHDLAKDVPFSWENSLTAVLRHFGGR